MKAGRARPGLLQYVEVVHVWFVGLQRSRRRLALDVGGGLVRSLAILRHAVRHADQRRLVQCIGGAQFLQQAETVGSGTDASPPLIRTQCACKGRNPERWLRHQSVRLPDDRNHLPDVWGEGGGTHGGDRRGDSTWGPAFLAVRPKKGPMIMLS
jgi:hypothetical protein